ncbi:MAG: TM2 domain-containing protein [Clostridiales bacterium]|nr:TM2 domain-containing protein [Clostridiales bacterium]
MYCRNCGTPLKPDNYICTKCGVPAGIGNKFCPSCANPTDENAVMCVRCGVFFAAPQNVAPQDAQQRSKLVAALLAFFLGTLGIHNFYLGYTNKGVTQLLLTLLASFLTCGLSAVAVQVWAIVEGVQLLTGTINTDGNGYPLKQDI